MIRKLAPLGILAILTLHGLSACGGKSGSASFGGQVSGTPALIAFVRSGDQAVAYVCDGSPSAVTAAEWFSGHIAGGSLDVTNADGAHLAATFTGSQVTGTVSLSGPPRTFTAASLKSDTGLYRAEGNFASVPYVGGWIVLSPTDQRGALSVAGKVGPAPTLNTSTRVVQITGAGQLAAARVAPLPANGGLGPFSGMGGGNFGFGGSP